MTLLALSILAFSDQFGINWPVYLLQLSAVAVVGLLPSLCVTAYLLRSHRNQPGLPLWLMLVWLVPVAGPVCACLALRGSHSAPPRPPSV